MIGHQGVDVDKSRLPRRGQHRFGIFANVFVGQPRHPRACSTFGRGAGDISHPKVILEREVRNYQKFIAENRALGECDHPDSSVVELKNASHIVREAYMDGDVCFGIVELLNTPSGKILQSLVESGVTLGISSRGVGSTKRKGDVDVVQDDFQLICWDFVSEPSTPGAFMMKEGIEVRRNDLDKVFNKSDRIHRAFNDVIAWSNDNE